MMGSPLSLAAFYGRRCRGAGGDRRPRSEARRGEGSTYADRARGGQPRPRHEERRIGVVARIAEAVAVEVVLSGIRNERAVVVGVAHEIAVGVPAAPRAAEALL